MYLLYGSVIRLDLDFVFNNLEIVVEDLEINKVISWVRSKE